MFLQALSPSCDFAVKQPGDCRNCVRQLPSQIVCLELYSFCFHLIIWTHTTTTLFIKVMQRGKVKAFDLTRDKVENRFHCMRGWSLKKKNLNGSTSPLVAIFIQQRLALTEAQLDE